MSDVACRICGLTFSPIPAPGPGEEPGEDALQQVCADCREKLSSSVDQDARSDRTTVLRPRSALGTSPRVATSLFGGKDNWTGPGSTLPVGGINLDEKPSGRPVSGTQDPSRTAQPPAVGKLFGNYEIMAEVSRGSFGVVYRAKQQGLERIVALKVLLAGAHASPEAIARFQREARAVAKLKHGNIVPIYDIGTQDGHHYFAMEFVEGQALSALIQNKSLTIPEALAIAESLADAIDSAHAQGVIHRDIKPSNILIDQKGIAHITDFGLAKQVDLDTQYTQSGTTLGTPAYMPPEQARGEVHEIDSRSDVYALGAVLYEMLTGKPPFAGRSLLEVVIAVINEPVRPPRQVNPRIHRDIQTIVMKCLEKEARNRYPSAAELRDDIRRFRSGEAIRARPVGVIRGAGRFLKKNSFFLGAVATVLLTVGLSTYWMIEQKRQFAEQERDNREKEEADRKRREREDAKLSQPVFKPFWWTPDKPDDNISEDERPLFRAGFVPMAAGKLIPDLVEGQQKLLTGTQLLCSPERKLILGDMEAKIRFNLNSAAAAKGVRIGLQSWDSAIPYVMAISPGLVSLVAPADLTRDGNLPGRYAPLRVKAEKRGPALTAGAYELKILREGLLLTFELTPPDPKEKVSLQIWDLGLSHWKFKNTQLSIREPPEGFAIKEATVLCKISPERTEKIYIAMNSFLDGEYNRADFFFKEIVDSPESQQDEKNRLRAAQASVYRGLIHDITLPGDRRDNLRYSEALDILDRCQPSREHAVLAVLIALRRIVNAYEEDNWPALDREIERIARFEPELARNASRPDGIGEPYAWELQPVIVALSGHKDTQAIDRALQCFQHLGLPPGNHLIDKSAARLAVRFADTEDRPNNLYALHKAYPAPGLLPAFLTVMQRGAAQGKAEKSLEALAYAVRHFSKPEEDAAIEKACAALFAECLKTRKIKFAGDLLGLFPRPALLTALVPSLGDLGQALTLEEIPQVIALLKLARKIAEPGPQTPPPLAEPILTEAVKAKAYDRAFAFYILARSELRPEAPRLLPRAADALEGLPDLRTRDQAIADLRKSTHAAFEKDSVEERLARLDACDLRVAAGNLSQASEDYQELFGEAGKDPDLHARVALRLGTLLTVLRMGNPLESWSALAEGLDTPEEVRLAGRFLLNQVALENLPSQLAQNGGPLFFTEAEWELIRALRLGSSGNVAGSNEALKTAGLKAEASRAWPWALAKALGRLNRVGPEAPAPKEKDTAPSQ